MALITKENINRIEKEIEIQNLQKELFNKILIAANNAYKKTMRSASNYFITNETIAKQINK